MPKTVGSGARTAALVALVALGMSGASVAQEDAPGQGPDHLMNGAGADKQNGGSSESGQGSGEDHGMTEGHGMTDGSGMMNGHDAEGGNGSGVGAAEAQDLPAAEAYRAANMAMHSAMEIEFSGDADIDFARGMIGHHQGAIDMARIVLEHGEDPDLRQLAEEIIEAQESEIAFLRDWIAEHAPG